MTELDALRILCKRIDLLHECIRYRDEGIRPSKAFLDQLENSRKQEAEVRELLGDLLTSR